MTIDQAAEDILAHGTGPYGYVVTPNVQHMVRLLDDKKNVRPLYLAAWRVLCDSRILSRLAKLMGIDLPVVTGSDLTAKLLARASERGLHVAVVGPNEADCRKLQALYPGLLVDWHTPEFGFIGNPASVDLAVNFVIETQAPVVFLAVGMPQQEVLARQIQDHPEARGIALCIGASIDFLTGRQRRAPVWMQHAGIEWMHRLLTNPFRLASRYFLECPRIFYFILLEGNKE